MRHHILLIAALAVAFASCANRSASEKQDTASGELQDAPCLENNFSRPAAVVFEEVAQRFGVTINNVKSVRKMMIPEADYLIYPWSVDETVEGLCERLGKMSYKTAEGVYEIRQNDHTRTSPEQGKKMLDYLSSLYGTRDEWEARRDTLRREFLKKIGLEQLPDASPRSPLISGKREYGDIYVENIAIEVLPGVYCTGSVYHPVQFSDGSCPIVLNPLGHFDNGRYGDQSQFLCQMLAKMGCVALSYDLFGWPGTDQGLQYNADDVYAVHRHAIAQNVQLLFGLRALDYLCALPEADLSRVAVTGASGGGSQSMFLTAVDDRITASIPVVMTSCYMNGGCPCESGNALQLICGRTCNTEIAAMCAPRPMLLVSDGHDWTAQCPEYDMPYLKRIYGFYGCPDLVRNSHFPEERHDYGPNKRNAVYAHLASLWGLDSSKVASVASRFDESCCTMEDVALLKNWGEDGSLLPEGAARTVEEVEAAWNARSPK